MPIESRFDELDLREEAARPEGGPAREAATYSCGHACPTTTVQPTFDCFG
jgi:hypothetical protein